MLVVLSASRNISFDLLISFTFFSSSFWNLFGRVSLNSTVVTRSRSSFSNLCSSLHVGALLAVPNSNVLMSSFCCSGFKKKKTFHLMRSITSRSIQMACQRPHPGPKNQANSTSPWVLQTVQKSVN